VALTPLERLAPALADRYRIEHELGAGGMATVYLARDLRHDRKVALKVLRPELAAVIGVERFLHEIKTVANLQHPHILPLHDSGEADGLVYYVMPFVEGESLRDRLVREQQLPIDDAVRIAREVADALDYAHRHNVVHRDIKPENILLHDGRAQVADFGIALAASNASGTRMTETGMSLGTPHYMAPEQAMGERLITPKADVYALGCVLYEMLVGEPPFNGPTAQAIIARVMTEEPRPLVTQRHTISPELEAVVRKALEKTPADRFPSAAAFSQALADPAAVPLTTRHTQAAVPGAAERRSGLRTALPLALGAALLSALATWAVTRKPAAPLPVARYNLLLPDSLSPISFGLSPDGSRLAFARRVGGSAQIWIKERDRLDVTPLALTSAAGIFSFSPDSRSIAFVQNSRLMTLPVQGGTPTAIGDSAAGAAVGIAWLDDGTLVYTQAGGATRLRRVAHTGGQSRRVFANDSLLMFLLAPLPESRGVLFTGCAFGDCEQGAAIWVLDLRSNQARPLIPGGIGAQYLGTGEILYGRLDGSLFRVRFDASSLQLKGEPVAALQGVGSFTLFNVPHFSTSRDGSLLVRLGAGSGERRYEMVWVDRAGRETPIDSSWTFRHTVAGSNAGWALSPDGSRLVIGLNTSSSGDDIWLKRLPDGPLSRLSFDSIPEIRPHWSPDGRSVIFGSWASNSVHRKNADGTGQEQTLVDLKQDIYEAVFSRDNKWLLLRTGGTVNQVGDRDIWAMQLGVDSAPRPLVVTPTFDEAAIALSPDSRWLAYESNETGKTEVFIRPFPNTDSGKEQVSNGGGVAPLWSRDGRELFYVNANRQMTAVSVAPAGPLKVGAPKVLFTLRDAIYLSPSENYTPYDVARDGRFIMARVVESAGGKAAPLTLVENWFQEWKQR